MRRTGTLTLVISSFFLAIVASILGSPGLFYMATALIAFVIAAKAQAWLAVRGLRIQRTMTQTAQVGDSVTVTFIVTSGRRISRPLVILKDQLPPRLRSALVTPALAIAPAYERPISTSYTLRPTRRGNFRWNEVEVLGGDAMGLAQSKIKYSLSTKDQAQLKVYPAPLAFEAPIAFGGAMGIDGGSRSHYARAGIDIRSIRNYVPGDPLRHIDWKATARTGNTMVKEFDSDTSLRAAIFIQDGIGTEIGNERWTTLESACGHAMFLAERLLLQGAQVYFPGLESTSGMTSGTLSGRLDAIRDLLADVRSNETRTLADQLAKATQNFEPFGQIFLFHAKTEDSLPAALGPLRESQVYAMLYDGSTLDRNVPKAELASSTSYSRTLEYAGAKTIFMPEVQL